MALGVLLLLVVGLTVYGAVVEPRFILDERRYEVTLPRLPEEHPGTTVAVFSDLQLGMWWANTGMVERIVRRAVEAEPDAVLIAGDFLYSESPDVAEQVEVALDLLAPLLEAGIPTFAVLGNHDYATNGADEVVAALEERGVEVLQNESLPLSGVEGNGGEALHVVGLGPHRPGLTDPQAALREVPDDAPRVVMMHNPASFPMLPANSAPLSVAGHTHCGQIAIPGFPRGSWLALPMDERVVVDGFAAESYGAEGNDVFVTCGIGFSRFPVRIGAAPQLVFFELVPE